jgi:hypothetical protein
MTFCRWSYIIFSTVQVTELAVLWLHLFGVDDGVACHANLGVLVASVHHNHLGLGPL